MSDYLGKYAELIKDTNYYTIYRLGVTDFKAPGRASKYKDFLTEIKKEKAVTVYETENSMSCFIEIEKSSWTGFCFGT